MFFLFTCLFVCLFVLVTGPLSFVNIIGEKQSGLASIFSITNNNNNNKGL